MGLYSVLFVDDEEEVINVIQKKLNWEEMGFTVAGSAANGVEALEFVGKNTPDVILSDIRMPYMDGLELTKRVRQLYPDIRIIIISGFDDFELAKRAISLGVQDYLLKPIDTTELGKLFEKTKAELDEEKQRQNSIERLEEYYRNSLPLLRESFLISLIEGNVRSSKLASYIEDYELKLGGPFYSVAVIHMSTSDLSEETNTRLLSMSIRELTEERMTHDGRHLIFTYQDDIVLIVQLDSADEISEFTDECDRFATQVQRTRDAVITVGIGRVTDRLADISSSYEGAREALYTRVVYGRGTAINIAEIEPQDSFDDTRENECFSRILRKIKLGSVEDVEESVDSYINTMIDHRPNPKRFRLLMMEMLTGLYRFMGHNEVDISQAGMSEDDPYGLILKIDSADELRIWLNGVSQTLRKLLQDQRSNATRSFVTKAKEYVQEHYGDSDLTIDVLCQELGVSAAYFSTVFKKETGQTFITYLTDYRMKEAVRMMIEQDEKTYIIAEKVGYSDANYFSYVFKKQYGMSPTKYKKQGNRV